MALGTAESAAVLIVLLGNVSAWAKMIFDNRKASKDGNGKGKPCDFHSSIESRIATVETHKAELAKSLENLHLENRQDHQKIFEDIKGLAISVASASASAASAATAAATAAAAALRKGKG